MRRSIILLVLLLAGCGASDEQRIRDTIDRYGEAIADGNPAKVCDELIGPDGPCEEQFTEQILLLSDKERAALRSLRVADVRIVGKVAEVTLKQDLDVIPDKMRLRKDGRKWSIDPKSV